MNEPTYHLSHVVKSKNAEPEDFSRDNFDEQ